MNGSVNGHEKQADVIMKVLWYEGTDALYEGEGVCYNTDYGTATDRDGRRANRVERPSTSNMLAFAGVAARDYSASSVGQFIEVFAPGSKGVNVALAVDTVIDTGILTFQAGGGTGAGRFYTGKYRGRGSVVPRQTVTALLEGGMTGATMSVDATDGITVTVADSTGMAAGDTLVIVAGENDATGVFTMGKHSISSITDGTTIVLTASCLSTLSTGSLTLTGYIYTGNAKCQADLLDGDESGGIEFLSPPNAGVVGISYMTEGVSYVCGVGTMAADTDVTFAQGTRPGQKKAFICLGTLGTSDFTLDLATNGIRLDGSTALTDINAIDTAADAVYLQFNGLLWHTMDLTGCTEA
jgi:predicted RecA/RadA family phage recombinase